MAARGKGTVTSLSSMFPAEEAQKAANLVNDTISEKLKELDNLTSFVADNTNLINLVQRLPDELHHDIQVLLGENYFADRTAKQTVDILKRRGQGLESQVGSLKAVIEDLKAKASFYDRTAAESEEGLVEIREELSDDEDAGGSPEKAEATSVCEVGNRSRPGAVDDEDYARIMSRFDELEKEELEEEEADTEELGDVTRDENFNNLDQEQSKDHHHAKVLPDRNTLPNDADNLIHESLSLQSTHKDESSRGKNLLQNLVERSTEEDYAPPVMKKSIPFESKSKSEICVPRLPTPKPDASNRLSRDSRPNTDSLKAFTGSIIERTDNLQISSDKETIDQPSNPQPSKPVSRFKMQRRAV
ncbi:RNA polymerase II subunit 5-mediating protein homolog isoform X2 [Chenopodium quinoa]|uniref:RNA polymerase II subunit 5-mediating protein homolog isoform X2 n=1 Tax=Chenopodium quinoa TaxID=63459 RepID=UPI000B7721B5|nr:RNA polymerase II subunit 5-mediating protein homolog isoform X2 [Chenopodium quinoa]